MITVEDEPIEVACVKNEEQMFWKCCTVYAGPVRADILKIRLHACSTSGLSRRQWNS